MNKFCKVLCDLRGIRNLAKLKEVATQSSLTEKAGLHFKKCFRNFRGEGAEKASDSILIVIIFIKLTIIIGTTTLGIALNYDNHSND